MPDFTSLYSYLELIAVITAIAYVVLAARENILCWFFGVVSSGLGIYVMYLADLPGQSILYVYYTAMAFFGWYMWGKKRADGSTTAIKSWSLKHHVGIIGIGAGVAFAAYYAIHEFGSGDAIILDSVTAVYSIVATYMMTIKVIQHWFYWIVIDIASLTLYASQDLYFYVLLYSIYLVLSVYGFVRWRKELAISAA